MIPRRTYLSRGTPPKRSRKRIKARYRTKGGRHSDPAKLDFVRGLPCLCRPDGGCSGGPVEAHHLRIRGEAAKDEKTLPLCEAHHRTGPRAYHRLGRRRFAAVHGLDDLEGLAAFVDNAYHAYLAEGRA